MHAFKRISGGNLVLIEAFLPSAVGEGVSVCWSWENLSSAETFL